MRIETVVTVSWPRWLPPACSARHAGCRGSVVGAPSTPRSKIAAYCSLLQLLGRVPLPSRRAAQSTTNSRWEKMAQVGTFSKGSSANSHSSATNCLGVGGEVVARRNLLMHEFTRRRIRPIPGAPDPANRAIEWPRGLPKSIALSHVPVPKNCNVAPPSVRATSSELRAYLHIYRYCARALSSCQIAGLGKLT